MEFHVREPRNVGKTRNANAHGHAGGIRSGPFVSLSARVVRRRIEEIRFETYACPIARGLCSFLTSALGKKSLDFAQRFDKETLLAAVGGLPRPKAHLAELATLALRDLLESVEAPDETGGYSVETTP